MATNRGRTYSQHYQELEEDAKKRYNTKLDIISEKLDDPYSLSALTITPQNLPDVQYPDIYNYLINTPNTYTKDDLKSYKSLDAYKYLLSGWVGDLSVCYVEDSNEKVILYAKVRHSQSVKASPVLPWVGVREDGTVICSHCTCMAGLGEVCSHIAAVLFAVQTYNRLNKDKACTSQLCAWLPPIMQNVKYTPIAEIDFTAPSTKRKKLRRESLELASSVQTSLAPPSAEELSCFYEALSKTGKPALLTLYSKYSDSYLLDYSMLSMLLTSLFDEKCIELSYDALLRKCEEAFDKIQVSVFTYQARNIEAH